MPKILKWPTTSDERDKVTAETNDPMTGPKSADNDVRS